MHKAMTKLIAVLMLAAIASIGASAAYAADALICGTVPGPYACKPYKEPQTCSGTVMVMDAWTAIDDCNFRTRSAVGEKILAVCTHGTKCWIENESVSRGEDDLRIITKMPRKIRLLEGN
jgi:hypothetical protein